MAFNPDDYDPRWPEVRRQILDQADHQCEFCGAENYDITVRGTRIVLTIAHLCWETCQDTRCIEPTHLRALCQRCHLNWDRRHHLAVQAANRALRKRQAFAATGQLAMELVS